MNKRESPQFKEIKRFRKENDLCMKCGFCISACPVYREELVESAVARGKNQIVRGLVNGQLEFTPELEKRLDKCTLCKTCTVNCPAKVNIPSVIIAARADQFSKRGTKFPYNFIYRSILPRRVLFGRAVKSAAVMQKLLFPKGEGTLRHLPMFLSGLGKGRHIPEVAPKFLRQSVPAVNSPPAGTAVKLKAGYMTGCMTDYIFPELGKKIINFLARNGVEVVVPREQGCCGAPVFLGAGDFETARKMADANVRAFKDLK
jgi:glycolate oxidase iron-sulfur subunit